MNGVVLTSRENYSVLRFDPILLFAQIDVCVSKFFNSIHQLFQQIEV